MITYKCIRNTSFINWKQYLTVMVDTNQRKHIRGIRNTKDKTEVFLQHAKELKSTKNLRIRQFQKNQQKQI